MGIVDVFGPGLPVRPLVTQLPLNELVPETFEQFSADLAAALHPQARVHRVGGQGHTQGGIDVIVHHPDGQTTGIQCKREKQFGPKKVQKAVGALEIKLDHCYIFLTRIASPEAQREVEKHSAWTLWDIVDLSSQVRSLQDRDAALRLVDTYFPGWRESFLGVPVPGPWLTTEEFFRQFAQGSIYSHEWELVGRDVNLVALRAFATAPDHNEKIAVVAGRGGIGKSRLLRAIAQDLGAEKGRTVRFLATGAEVTPQHFEILPPDDGLLVVVDDAHDREDTAAIIAGIERFRPTAKVLLSLRPYGLPQLHTDLRPLGVHPSEVSVQELTDLTAREAERLARTILGPDSQEHVATWLAEMAADCPLLIVVGAQLIARGVLDPARFDASDDIRAEILSLFGDIVAGTPGTSEGDLRREILKAVAVLQPLRLDESVFQTAMLALTGRPFDQLLPHLHSLQDAGVLLRRGNSLRIVPDLLGDVILADAAVDTPSGISTGYLERVCGATSGDALAHAVVNAGRVDWRPRKARNGTGLAVDVLWNALTAEYEAASTSSRYRILQAVRAAAAFQPRHAIALVRLALSKSAVPGESVCFTSDDDNVARVLPTILYRAALSLNCLVESADLLWDLARHDVRPVGQDPDHPMRLLAELSTYDVGKTTEFQGGMISIVQRWLRDDTVVTHPHSPFAVLEPILATEVEHKRFDGLSMTLSTHPVSLSAVRSFRDRVVDLVFAAADADDVRHAVRAVNALQAALRYPRGAFRGANRDEDNDRWSPEFVKILNRFADLAVYPGLDPVVAVAIRKVVQWHADYAPGATASAARTARAKLPQQLEHQLAHVLHDGWGPSVRETDDYATRCRRQKEHSAEVAAAVCERWAPEEVVNRLADCLSRDSYAFGTTAANPHQFVEALMRCDAEIGVALARRVISDSINSNSAESTSLAMLRQLVPAALSTLTELLTVEAMSLARALFNTPSIDNARAVAHAFGVARGNRATLLDGEVELLCDLSVHADPYVRRGVVHASRLLGDVNRALATQLITSVRFGDSTELASEVAALLTAPGSMSWKTFDDAQIADFLEQLHACRSIDDYHIHCLLAEISAVRPEEILDLLMRRVETYEDDPSAVEYQPIPYQWHEPLRLQSSQDFERLLRRVVEWISHSPWGSRRAHVGARLFTAIAVQYNESVLQLLAELVASGSRERILAVGTVLRGAPNDLVWTHSNFVIKALQAAEALGEDCARAIGSGLRSAIISGSRVSVPGQPNKRDLEQRDKATELAKTLPPGSIEHRFYHLLASGVASWIKAEADEDELLDDRRSW
ncbi:restriction endonuclease [Allokutzneria sp. NRRL B-24872]|uniref:restriction endonuclease n=1 Tax=Allokutzneria sp. NRRL B-24872 TaxID=1137961 RepID=UPI001FF0435A|nr:restriction endonuclease [Allokutzneria sp. NRRL B-24872]